MRGHSRRSGACAGACERGCVRRALGVRRCFGKLNDERHTANLHHGRVVTFSVRTQHSFLNELLSHEDEDFKQFAEVHAQTTTPIRTRMRALMLMSHGDVPMRNLV